MIRLVLIEAYVVECYSWERLIGLVLFLKDVLYLVMNKFNLRGDGFEN